MSKRRKISQGKHDEIMAQTGGACFYCGYAANCIDHIIPRSWGANDSERNLVPACDICNSIASNKHFDNLNAKKEFILSERASLKWRRRISAMSKSGVFSMFRKRSPGRQKGFRASVQPSNVIQAITVRLGLTGEILTFQDIADKLAERSGVRVTKATVWRFANGREPRAPNLRFAFGLPVRAEVEVCQKCGKPHEMLKQCGPRKAHTKTPRRNWKRLATWAAAVLMIMPAQHIRE
jgi:hypothetical protein